jgi:hypothetical protein
MAEFNLGIKKKNSHKAKMHLASQSRTQGCTKMAEFNLGIKNKFVTKQRCTLPLRIQDIGVHKNGRIQPRDKEKICQKIK